jgi:Bacteriophage lambda tail assembly protein I.
MKTDKISLVSMPNRWRPSTKSFQYLEHSTDDSLKSYIEKSVIYDSDEKYLVVLNGRVVGEEDFEIISVEPGAIINISPLVAGGGGGGKNVLTLVASLALAYVSFGVGGLASGKAWGAAAAAWTTTGTIAAAATMFIGGMLINRLTPTPKIDRGGNDGQSQTYAWGQLQPLQGQGNSVGITFGHVRAATQILAQYVSVQGDKQYLNILLCAGEGPLDSIEDIKINDNPLSNYKDVELEIRLGTNIQSVIPFFGDTYADMNLSYDLNTIGEWRTQQMGTNTTQGIEIQVELPSGLAHMNAEGKNQSAWVRISAQYRILGGDWVDWLNNHQITANQTTPLRRVFRVDNVEIGQYEVRAMCSAKSGTSATRDINMLRWIQLSSVFYDDFQRPNKALVGIRALATDQLSGGMPSITYEQKRMTVWVFNDVLGIYEEKAADNPAWACYDLIHYCRRLQHPLTYQWQFKVFGASRSKMIYEDFKIWADWCDEMDLKVDLFIETQGQLYSKLQDLSICGRGMVIQRGMKFGCICDKPSDPVQLFTMGNIVSGSFTESFLDLPERANEVEISFNNRDKNWEKDIIPVYGASWDNDELIKNPTAITIDGISRWNQAFRHAMYLLKNSEFIVRTVSFDADVDAIACQVGDVILVQHDLPKWGRGGRILGGTIDRVQLDQKVFLEPGVNYEVRIRDSLSDKIENREVLGVTEELESDWIDLKDPLSFEPSPLDDIYSFGEIDKSAKPFRVINIQRTQDQMRMITAIEYIESLYNENYDFPIIDYADSDNQIRNLIATTSFSEDGTYWLNISWTHPRTEISKIRIFINRNRIADVDSTEFFYCWEPTAWGDVEITVAAFNNLGMEISSRTITYTISDPLPESVPSFSVSFVNQSKQFIFDWMTPDSINPIDGYEIRRGQAWSAAQPIKRIDGRNMIRDSFIAVRGRSQFWICAYNRYGYSPTPIAFEIDVAQMPGQDIIEAVPDYEETGTIEGYGELLNGSLIQWSGLTVGFIKSHTWGELKEMDWISGTMGPVTATGQIVDIGKAASIIVWVDEIWAVIPDQPSFWEYQASFDGINYSDWRPLPTSEIEGRYFIFRVAIRGINRGGVLRSANLLIDVPENEVKISAMQIPKEGIYINFVPQFVRNPTIQITPNNESLLVEKTEISGAGCFVRLLKGELVGTTEKEYAPIPVAGEADIFATGF